MTITKTQRSELIREAIEARRGAYAPYSGYAVGAALLTVSGKVYRGANVENAAYPTSMCAERVALFNAVSEGERQFAAIAVATENGGFPCGSCRQALSEFGLDMRVIVVDSEGLLNAELGLEELLPRAFGPDDFK
ncbi:MAG: cytidine deaminase [Anaerolineales bacterium]|jgi:cytidine deaminase